MNDWPRLLAFADQHPGQPLALATLVGRTGSSYRQPGARLLVNLDREFTGSLSGGCLEDGVAAVARRVLQTGRNERLQIDTRPHFGCAGTLDIWVEPISATALETLRAGLASRQTFTWETHYSAANTHSAAPSAVFCETIPPRPRLLVAGAARDAEAVCRQASLLGWEIHRLAADPATLRDLLPVAGEQLHACPPEAVATRFPPDARTALLIMTHHLGRDTAYLRHALREPYGYVGLLGSRRRREEIFRELGEAGLFAEGPPPDTLHAPVGLDIGADTPEAIALAIVAEIHAYWQNHDGGSLRLKSAAIHAGA